MLRSLLSSPEDWETWDTQFKAKSVASELWDLSHLINPIEALFATKPVAPKVEQYDKRAERSDSQTQILEQVDRSGRPSNTYELTTAARVAFSSIGISILILQNNITKREDQSRNSRIWCSKRRVSTWCELPADPRRISRNGIQNLTEQVGVSEARQKQDA